MKKSNSNIALWLLLIAALGGGAAYLISRKKKKVDSPVQRQTGLLVDSTQKTTLTPKEGIELVKALKKKVKSSTVLSGCKR